MAARTFSGTGNWSDVTKWDGGVAIPVAGDTVTIAAAADCTMDSDYSGGAGLAGVTINGILRAGAGYLKMDGTSGHNITFGAAGQLLGGSADTPLPAATVFTIDLNGASVINASGAASGAIALYCTQPTHTYCKLTTQANAAQALLAVDTDITGAGDTAFWANGHTLRIDNVNKARDTEALNFSSATSTQITLSSNLVALKIAGTYVFITWRNIRIIGGTSTTGVIQNATAPILQCEIALGTGAVGLASSLKSPVFSGIMHGGATATSNIDGFIWSGIVTGTSNVGLNNSSGYLFSGIISGCPIADSAGAGGIGTSSAIITGCNMGPLLTNLDYAGVISGCTYGIRSPLGAILRGAILSNNSVDIDGVQSERWPDITGFGASLNSTTQVSVTGLQSATGREKVEIFDIGGAAGSYKKWQPGAANPWVNDGSNVLSNAPASLTQYKGQPGSTTIPCYVDIPFWGRNGVAINVTVYCKKDTNSMTETPNAQIIDPDKQMFLAGADVLASATMADNTSLQALTMSYTPSADRPLIFRFRGKNASGNMWFAVQGLGGESPGTPNRGVLTGGRL